jgi:hypothetical protein
MRHFLPAMSLIKVDSLKLKVNKLAGDIGEKRQQPKKQD